MTASNNSRVQEEINPTVELLNQTCLDLVDEIGRLKRENTRLRQRMGEVGNLPANSFRARESG